MASRVIVATAGWREEGSLVAKCRSRPSPGETHERGHSRQTAKCEEPPPPASAWPGRGMNAITSRTAPDGEWSGLYPSLVTVRLNGRSACRFPGRRCRWFC